MTGKSLYTVNNDLDPGRGELSHLQLNPAVVRNDRGSQFTLSTVYIGPRRAEPAEAIALGLEADNGSARFESLHSRTEPSGEDYSLTVAVFPVSREVLGRLATDSHIRIYLERGGERTQHAVDDRNRRNVATFLDEADRHATAFDASPASTASIAV